MSLYIHPDHTALPLLRSEGIDVNDAVPAGRRPLRVLLLNLMPLKFAAEMDYYRMLSYTSLDVEVKLVKLSGLQYKNTPQWYMDQFYTDIRDVQSDDFDGLIITGAPVENMPFEDVRYWEQLQQVMAWSEQHVRATLFVCWAAQAGLYHFYDIPKYPLDDKMFGIFTQTPSDLGLPLFRGFDSRFNMPHSRHTEVRRSDIERVEGLSIWAASEESGVSIVAAREGRQIFVTGHMEYHAERLQFEYERDAARGLPILPPKHYYVDDCPDCGVLLSWTAHAHLLYTNWLTFYCAHRP